jgi:L-tryptophan--pyruvate aminotransferase
MVKYVELNTIGVSKDSQLRAAKVLQVVTDGCKYPTSKEGSLFDFAAHLMEERWKLLRAAVRQSGLFTLPEFPPGSCRFLNISFAPRPGKHGLYFRSFIITSITLFMNFSFLLRK